jgi:hypothetical protein
VKGGRCAQPLSLTIFTPNFAECAKTNPLHGRAPAPLTGRRPPDPALAPLLVRRVSAASGVAAALVDESAVSAKGGHCSRLASPTNTQPSQEILQAGQLQLAERALPTVRPSPAHAEPRALLAGYVAWPARDARRANGFGPKELRGKTVV